MAKFWPFFHKNFALFVTSFKIAKTTIVMFDQRLTIFEKIQQWLSTLGATRSGELLQKNNKAPDTDPYSLVLLIYDPCSSSRAVIFLRMAPAPYYCHLPVE